MSGEHDVVEQLLNEVEFLRAMVTRLVEALSRSTEPVDARLSTPDASRGPR